MITTRTLNKDVVQSSQKRGDIMPDWASISVRDASKKTGYSEQYLRRLIRENKIEAEKIGQVYLIRSASLDKYLAEMDETNDGRAGPRLK